MYGERSARSTGGWFEHDDRGRSHLSLHEPVVRDLRRHLGGIRTVLDLGCGIGMYGELIRTRVVFPKDLFLIGVDANMEYMRNPRLAAYYNRRMLADLFEVIEGQLALPIDCVLCMDVVEHFERPKALRLLDWLHDRPLAYISTPLFWYEQSGPGVPEAEQHRSFFTERELLGLGWKSVAKVAENRGELGAFRNVN